MASYAAATKLERFISVTINGFNAGQSTFTGQNMGAGKLERIYRGHRATALMSGLVTAFLALLCVVLARPVCGLFGVTGEALDIAAYHVRFIAPCFVIFALYGTYTSVLQGAGDTTYASFCTLSSLIIRVGVAYAFAAWLHTGFFSVCYSGPVAWVWALAVGAIRYFKGTWKTKGIIQKA